MTAQELEVTIEIVCKNPPAAGSTDGGALYLGIQHEDQVIDALPVSSQTLVFRPTLRVRRHTDGSANFRGPYAHGPRAERFLYLNWIRMKGTTLVGHQGRIKLHLSHIPWHSIQRAAEARKPLKVTLPLSNAAGKPVYASVRADAARWAL